MRLKNIECQLTQGQLTRYLRGDALSDTAIEQLESHLSECDDCAEYLDELKSELMPDEPEIVEEDQVELAPASPESSNHGAPKFLVDAIRFKREKLDQAVRPVSTHAVIETSLEPAPAPKTYLKPLLYSLGLAAVMVGMTSIMRDPTKLFGERLDTKLASTVVGTPPTTESSATEPPAKATGNDAVIVKPSTNVPPPATGDSNVSGAETRVQNRNRSTTEKSAPPTATPPAADSKPIAAPKSSSPKKSTAPAPKPLKRRDASRKSAAFPKSATTKRTASRNGIRVYDGTGNPVNH